MTPKQIIDPTPGGTPPSISQGIRVGDTIYVSGQVAFGADGEIVGVGDAAAQAEQCFKNLEAVLEAAGASLADVVKLTNFFTSADYFPAYRDVKQRLLPKDPPASTSSARLGKARVTCKSRPSFASRWVCHSAKLATLSLPTDSFFICNGIFNP